MCLILLSNVQQMISKACLTQQEASFHVIAAGMTRSNALFSTSIISYCSVLNQSCSHYVSISPVDLCQEACPHAETLPELIQMYRLMIQMLTSSSLPPPPPAYGLVLYIHPYPNPQPPTQLMSILQSLSRTSYHPPPTTNTPPIVHVLPVILTNYNIP